MIKSVFIDFDWTLYSHARHSIPESAIEALRRAHDSGVKLVLSTGRNMSEMELVPQYKEIPFDAFITANGQICLDKEGNMIFGNPIKGKALEELVKIFNSKEMPIVFADEKQTYTNFKNQKVIDAHKAITYVDHPIKPYTGKPVYLAVLYIDQEEEKAMLARLGNVDSKRWGPIGIDIVSKGVDKATGLQKVLDYFGLTREESMAIGDSFNDIGMLEFAAIGVAMGNGEEETKQSADYITDDIDNDGLAKALKHFSLA